MFEYYSMTLVICWIALGTVCILVHENGRISKADKRLLWLTYVLIGLSALAEWMGLYFNGRENLPRWVLTAVKCVDYILSPMAGATLVLQMRIRNRLRDVLVAVLGVNVIFQLMAALLGGMITIDDTGHYHHGPLYPAYIGIYLLVILIVGIEFVLYGMRFKKHNRVSLAAILLLILAGIVIQELSTTGYRTVYMALTLGALLMYIHMVEFSQMTTDEILFLQRSQLNEDPLTGLGSRYAYIQDLKEYDSAGSLPKDLAAFMIDINGLKTVNDTMGHEAGDELIRGAADCIGQSFRPEGKCYRTGGDEFVVLARLTPERTEQAAERFRKACAAWKGSGGMRLQVSVGWACAGNQPAKSCEELIRLADEKMYQAKALFYQETGRERRGRRPAEIRRA